MSSEVKIFSIIFFAILLVWGGLAFFLEKEIEEKKDIYKEKSEQIQEYNRLKSLWSQKSQKESIEKVENILKIYDIKAKIEKSRGKKVYTFKLNRKNVDKILSKILNSSIEIASFKVKKESDEVLEVEIGVAF